MDLIKVLTKLEPVFKQAADMAYEMQSTTKSYKKLNSGLNMIDIVTEADLAVQEFLLQELAKTDLVHCRMLAEENTPLVSKFTGKNGYYLAVDPIDGTAIYSRGGKSFSVIISFHDGKDLLYTFQHFPVLNWTQKIVNKTYTTIGKQPVFESSMAGKEKILYYRGDPKKQIPELYKDLTAKGMEFISCPDHLDDIDEQAMFICGQIGGFYIERPSAYDGVRALHFAQATNRGIYPNAPNGSLDFSNIQKDDTGLYYPGYYLVLNK